MVTETEAFSENVRRSLSISLHAVLDTEFLQWMRLANPVAEAFPSTSLTFLPILLLNQLTLS